MKVKYYCRHSTFDTEHWACYLTRGKKTTSITSYRTDVSPESAARQSTDMRMYGYLETYDQLPDEMKQEFISAVKKLGGRMDDVEFEKPPF